MRDNDRDPADEFFFDSIEESARPGPALPVKKIAPAPLDVDSFDPEASLDLTESDQLRGPRKQTPNQHKTDLADLDSKETAPESVPDYSTQSGDGRKTNPKTGKLRGPAEPDLGTSRKPLIPTTRIELRRQLLEIELVTDLQLNTLIDPAEDDVAAILEKLTTIPLEGFEHLSNPKSMPTDDRTMGVSIKANRFRIPLVSEHQRDLILKGFYREIAYDHFLAIKEIGRGGMGRVYLARPYNLNKLFAIKTIFHDLGTGSSNGLSPLKRFLLEIDRLALLEHPGIAQIIHKGSRNGVPFYVMDLVSGQDLDRVARNLRNRGKQPDLGWTIDVFIQVADALGCAHTSARTIVHRDVKPSNIMVQDDGRAKLLDFGIAKAIDHGKSNVAATTTDPSTIRGDFIGTPEFAPPEQFFEPDKISPASDIYSLGITLYYVLVGEVPFTGPNWITIGTMHRDPKKPMPSARAVRKDLPKSIDTLLGWMCKKNPADRPKSMYQVIDALNQIKLEVSSGRPSKRSMLVYFFAATALLSVLTTAALVMQPTLIGSLKESFGFSQKSSESGSHPVDPSKTNTKTAVDPPQTVVIKKPANELAIAAVIAGNWNTYPKEKDFQLPKESPLVSIGRIAVASPEPIKWDELIEYANLQPDSKFRVSLAAKIKDLILHTKTPALLIELADSLLARSKSSFGELDRLLVVMTAQQLAERAKESGDSADLQKLLALSNADFRGSIDSKAYRLQATLALSNAKFQKSKDWPAALDILSQTKGESDFQYFGDPSPVQQQRTTIHVQWADSLMSLNKSLDTVRDSLAPASRLSDEDYFGSAGLTAIQSKRADLALSAAKGNDAAALEVLSPPKSIESSKYFGAQNSKIKVRRASINMELAKNPDTPLQAKLILLRNAKREDEATFRSQLPQTAETFANSFAKNEKALDELKSLFEELSKANFTLPPATSTKLIEAAGANYLLLLKKSIESLSASPISAVNFDEFKHVAADLNSQKDVDAGTANAVEFRGTMVKLLAPLIKQFKSKCLAVAANANELRTIADCEKAHDILALPAGWADQNDKLSMETATKEINYKWGLLLLSPSEPVPAEKIKDVVTSAISKIEHLPQNQRNIILDECIVFLKKNSAPASQVRTLLQQEAKNFGVSRVLEFTVHLGSNESNLDEAGNLFSSVLNAHHTEVVNLIREKFHDNRMQSVLLSVLKTESLSSSSMHRLSAEVVSSFYSPDIALAKSSIEGFLQQYDRDPRSLGDDKIKVWANIYLYLMNQSKKEQEADSLRYKEGGKSEISFVKSMVLKSMERHRSFPIRGKSFVQSAAALSAKAKCESLFYGDQLCAIYRKELPDPSAEKTEFLERLRKSRASSKDDNKRVLILGPLKKYAIMTICLLESSKGLSDDPVAKEPIRQFLESESPSSLLRTFMPSKEDLDLVSAGWRTVVEDIQNDANEREKLRQKMIEK